MMRPISARDPYLSFIIRTYFRSVRGRVQLAFPTVPISGLSSMRAVCCLALIISGAFFPLLSHAEISLASCEAAQKYSAAHGGLSLLVLKNDNPFYEAYSNGFGPDMITSIFSGTKGFWCVAAIAAQQDGILDLDEPVAKTITEWEGKPDKEEITVRNLLSFTAGIEPVFSLHGRSIPDRNTYSIALHPAEPPGRAFMYGPSELQIFCEVLRRKLARRHLSPQEYLRRRILTPLGIYDVDFRDDEAGNPLLASGFKLTARQWSRLGLLILHEGKYGHRQIVPADALSDLFRGSHANPIFGMGFWLNGTAGEDAKEVDVEKMLDIPWRREDWHNVCLCQNAPSDMIAAIGSEYQRMFIFPSLNMIIVRQGRERSFSDAKFLRLILDDEDRPRLKLARMANDK